MATFKCTELGDFRGKAAPVIFISAPNYYTAAVEACEGPAVRFAVEGTPSTHTAEYWMSNQPNRPGMVQYRIEEI